MIKLNSLGSQARYMMAIKYDMKCIEFRVFHNAT